MKRTLIGAALLAASPLFAQVAPAPDPSELVVAKINGEVITRATLDHLWKRLGPRGQQQYVKAGDGKARFLDYYIRKRLLLQQAVASGFDQKPDVQAELEAAKESALFDFYIREVVASQVVTDAEIRRYYDENLGKFSVGERRYLRSLVIKTDRGVEAAREKLAPIFGELLAEHGRARRSNLPPAAFGRKFSEYARKFSEDPSAAAGGEIGWFEKPQVDPKIAEAVFAMPAGQMSGMLDGAAGLALIYVESVRPPEEETFEQARPAIREYLLGTHMNKIVEAVNQTTTALRSSGKVEMFPENMK